MKIDFKDTKNSKPLNSSAYFADLMSIGAKEGDIKHFSVDMLKEFKGQPFKPYGAERLLNLADDIKQNGILHPLIVRPCNDGKYQILAGHNRLKAAAIAGLTEVPCIIKDVDDDTAQLILVNSNLNQRQKLLPSEKAYAYKLQLEILKRQGRRIDTDIKNSIGKMYPNQDMDFRESRRTIQRYIRLASLIPELLQMVDDNKIIWGVGVQLSYLSEELQKTVYEIVSADKTIKLDISKIKLLRRRVAEDESTPLTEDEIKEVLCEKEVVPYLEVTKVIKKSLPKDITMEDAKAIAELINSYFKGRCE